VEQTGVTRSIGNVRYSVSGHIFLEQKLQFLKDKDTALEQVEVVFGLTGFRLGDGPIQ
jgi:hypothetical protein